MASLPGSLRRFTPARGAPLGATGLMPPAPPETAPPADPRIAIAVVGAHLSGLPLNGELTEVGGRLLYEAETTKDYRLFALGGEPPKPGMLRVAEGTGSAIRLEVWSLDPAAFGALVARIPAPLGIGAVRLADGTAVKGFLVEAEAVRRPPRTFRATAAGGPISHRIEWKPFACDDASRLLAGLAGLDNYASRLKRERA